MSQQLSTKSLELTKVIHLLEDPLTVSQTEHHQTLLSFLFRSAVLKTLYILFSFKANLKERHLFVLKKLLKRSQIGFVSFLPGSSLLTLTSDNTYVYVLSFPK